MLAHISFVSGRNIYVARRIGIIRPNVEDLTILARSQKKNPSDFFVFVRLKSVRPTSMPTSKSFQYLDARRHYLRQFHHVTSNEQT